MQDSTRTVCNLDQMDNLSFVLEVFGFNSSKCYISVFFGIVVRFYIHNYYIFIEVYFKRFTIKKAIILSYINEEVSNVCMVRYVHLSQRKTNSGILLITQYMNTISRSFMILKHFKTVLKASPTELTPIFLLLTRKKNIMASTCFAMVSRFNLRV